MSISNEAVEAARDAMKRFELQRDQDGRLGWDAYALVALEAAAPHLLAVAWDEGMWAMYNTTSSEWPPIPKANPYRSARAGE